MTTQFGKTELLVCGEHGAIPLLKLTSTQAEDLVRGRDIEGETLIPSDRDRVAAWRISFSVPRSLSILYALLPHTNAGEIDSAQTKAALTVMRELAGCILGVEAERGHLGAILNRDSQTSLSQSVNGATASPTKQEQQPEAGSCAFVVFNSVATLRQNPELQTTAFLLNAIKLPGGQVRNLASAERVMKTKPFLAEAYANALEFAMWSAIGSPRQKESLAEVGVRDVPADLEKRIFYEPQFDRGWPDSPGQSPLDLRGLFAKWREQAESAQWGPKKAKALLKDMRSNQFREDLSGNWSLRKWEAKTVLHQLNASTFQVLSHDPLPKQQQVASNDKGMSHTR